MTYKQITFNQSEVLREFEKLSQSKFISIAEEPDASIKTPINSSIKPGTSQPTLLSTFLQATKPLEDINKRIDKHLSNEEWSALDYALSFISSIPTPLGNPLAGILAAKYFKQKQYFLFFINALVAFPAESGLFIAGDAGKIAHLICKLALNFEQTILMIARWTSPAIIRKTLQLAFNFFNMLRSLDTKSLIKNFIIHLGLESSFGEKGRFIGKTEEKFEQAKKEYQEKCEYDIDDIAKKITEDNIIMCQELQNKMKLYQ